MTQKRMIFSKYYFLIKHGGFDFFRHQYAASDGFGFCP